MPAGRPKEPFIPWDGWQDDILNLYKEGASDVEVRGLIWEKMGRKSLAWILWDRWLKEEEEFCETIKGGRLLSQIWWEREGRKNIKQINTPGESNINFNFTGWYMNMKNRFGWRDKQEMEMSGSLKVLKLDADEQQL